MCIGTSTTTTASISIAVQSQHIRWVMPETFFPFVDFNILFSAPLDPNIPLSFQGL